MGAVFLAQDTALDRPVALKIPVFGGTLTAGQKERFFREARAISALRHPNLCPVFDVDEEQGIVYLTMAYIDGQPLSALIQRGPVEPAKAVELVRRVARAMHEAHIHGTIHRDLKPANILIDKGGEPVVMDFGLARRATWGEDSKSDGSTQSTDAGLTQFGSVLGTPAYMPPEQARGLAGADPRTDVFGLGGILCEILTGEPPYVGDDATSVTRRAAAGDQEELALRLAGSDVDRFLVSVARSCLSPDPADRPADASEVARLINNFRTARECRDRPAAGRYARVAGLLTAAVALAAATLIGVTARDFQARGADHGASPGPHRAVTPTESPPPGPACPPSAASW
jgi:serine/threonine protein kinase